MHILCISPKKFIQSLFSLGMLLTCTVHAQYTFSTLAGTAGTAGNADGNGTAARFYNPAGVAVDSSGNTFVADVANQTIRKITPSGTVSTFAGAVGQVGSTDGVGTAARFNYPWGLAIDSSNNLYVTDSENHTVRKITPGGTVSTFAGSGGLAGSSDGTGTAARFNNPAGIAVDSAGTLYVSDYTNSTIRKVSPAGAVTTLAGTAGIFGSANGAGASASFNYPDGIAVDASGNVFVVDTNNNVIRKISPAGVVSTYAGTVGAAADTDGVGASARFNFPVGVAVDADGNLYITDKLNQKIRKIFTNQVVTTLGGNGVAGSTNGIGSVAQFNAPTGITISSTGTLYLSDPSNQLIRKGVRSIGPGVNFDFNADGKRDLLWENVLDGQRAVWFLNDTTVGSTAALPSVPTEWRMVAAADFSTEGKTDILWENTLNGRRVIWLMNGVTFGFAVELPSVPTEWRMVAAADFNRDDETDILWENMLNGRRVVWLMNGSSLSSTIELPSVPTDWHMAAAGDFNADDKTDILWENTVNGRRVVWLMNDAVFGVAVELPTVPTDWRIAAAGDYNRDSQTDIVWENTADGQHCIWLMNGTTFTSRISLPDVPTEWCIAK